MCALLAPRTSLCSLGVHTLILAALRRLSQREALAVDVLAPALAVPPQSLRVAMTQALAWGAPLEIDERGRCRLVEAPDWLDAARIEAAVAGSGLQVQVVDCCASTNLALRDQARRGAPCGSVLAAEWQTQGRGRQGRPWQSGVASALTFSLLWRFDRARAGLDGLSLAVGVAIARALRRRGAMIALKWPNDLLWQGRKLGGVLIEVQGDPAGACAVVIGIGLNVRLHASERARIDQPAADLNEAGAGAMTRNDWLAAVLIELAAVLRQFEREGFAPLRDEWARLHAHAGQRVELALPSGERREGTAAGVDASGRLLLVTARGTQAVASGDVSLRASA